MHYQRHIDPDGDDSLARLLRRIRPGATVLELGPATGYCSRYLNEVLGCAVDAIELSADMAELARPWCREIFVGDIEQIDLDAILSGRRYDVILCADVLEHLRDPWALAQKLRRWLVADGCLLVSVPNVGYLGLLVDLLRGNFRYRDEGLLDRTHLRFFTFDSLGELLQQSGWHVWAAEQVSLSLTDSEFRVRLESMAPDLRDELLARPDALCYQWVVEARLAPSPNELELPQVPPEDRFQVRVFWRAPGAQFVEAQNRLVWGFLGRQNQSIVVPVPQGNGALAIRLSNRVGFVRLHEIVLSDVAGDTLWQWSLVDGPLPVHTAHAMRMADASGLWFVEANDSWLDLRLDNVEVARAGCVVLRLDAPMSADYLSALAYWAAAREQTTAECDALREQLKRCDERLAVADSVLGEGEAGWRQSARLLRFCRSVPGLVSAINALAAWRRRVGGAG